VEVISGRHSIVFLYKNNNAENIAYNKESITHLKPKWWGLPLGQGEKYQEWMTPVIWKNDFDDDDDDDDDDCCYYTTTTNAYSI
jgi:hypothetical protein